MGSTVVRLDSDHPPAHSLAFVAGLAVHAAVSPWLENPDLLLLKWPNDLLLAGGKLSGILIERTGDRAVIGIGVNLASAPEVPGRSLSAVGQFGRAPDRDRFAHELGEHFALELARWRELGLADVVPRWKVVAHPVGTKLHVNMPQGDYVEGEFAGLSDDGALMLHLASSEIRIVHAGDVSICGEEA